MNLNKYHTQLKHLTEQLQEQSKIMEYFQTKVKSMVIERLPNEIRVKCSCKNCPKQATYKFSNSYYCWYHRIDLNIRDNLQL